MYVSQKIELSPNKSTQDLLEKYFGYSRYIFNKGLETWNILYDEYKKGNSLFGPTSRTIRDQLKKQREDWEEEYCPQVLETSTEDVAHAFKLFRKGASKNLPKFKSKKKQKNTFRIYRKNRTSIKFEGNKKNYLKLVRIPAMRMKELPKYPVELAKEVTISKRAGKYFAGIVFDMPDNYFENLYINNNDYCGIDLGVKTLASINDSNDQFFECESIVNKLIKYNKKLKIYDRLMSKKIYGSNNYNAMRIKLQRLYMRIQNVRDDYIHKFTTWVVRNYKYITIETLVVKFFIGNKRISKKISDSLFYKIKLMLTYKSEYYNNILILADRFYPSSQRCSNCGHTRIKENKIKLKERDYICPKCGMEMDRDMNAAVNLKQYGMSIIG